ncbi:MAG: endonuclease MutS2 [Thermosynechococcaceae cyanobacterium MS004]|nr:endonuclease MutS2 [Thermosynechococcaceae cyanobacterium MS004]
MPVKTLELLEWSRLTQHLSTFAATKLGSLVTQRLVPPPTLDESQNLLKQTQEMAELESSQGSLSFEGVQDISASLDRCARQGVLSGLELLHIATTLSAARQLRRAIDRSPTLVSLNTLVADLRTYPELEQEIHHAIDDQGEVTDRASEKLRIIRDRQQQNRQQVQRILQSILQRKASALQELLITQRGDRFVIPVKAAQKDAIPGIVHDASASGVTLYIEPQATVNFNNQLRQLARQEQEESERVRRILSEKVAAVQPELESLLDVVTQLDLAVARARYSYWLGGNIPTFIDRNHQAINLRQLRHPLLYWQEKHEQGAAVVPIDVVIPPHVKTVAVTGPNTGGKTVMLKNLGLAVLMAKAGLYIPAKDPVEIPWFDQVLADIGDEQSLQQSLSTFSGHIRRIQSMVEILTPGTLVLLDEVGAGTDPSEGTALAIALLKYLTEHTQLTIATTHFGELKTLKYQDSRFENASVEFDDVTLSPTYRLLWGIPGRSNALVIAERLGLRSEIIQAAQQAIHHHNADLNAVIADLETQRRNQEQKNKEAEHLLRHTEFLHRELTQKAAELKERERSLRQQQEQSVQAEIQAAKAEIAKVIRTLQQGPQTAQAAQRATQALGSLGAGTGVTAPQPQPQVQAYRPQVGDRIRIPRLGNTAEVISPATETGELTVRLGLMKLTVQLDEVESLTGEKAAPVAKTRPPSKPPSTTPSPSPSSPPPVEVNAGMNKGPEIRTSQNTLDIRGQRVSDAEILLDNAIASAQETLWIIHGHGTGKLRQGVQDYLSRHPRVESFDFAAQTDGGRGVTVARCRT